MDITRRLAKYNIDPESTLGKMLLSLDKVYENIEVEKLNIKQSNKKLVQLKEDADLMENAIMYYINKEVRNNNGD